MGIFRKKKKGSGEKMIAAGLYLKPAEAGRKTVLFQCFTKGILVFLVVFGSLGGFLSALHLDFHVPVVAGLLLFCALYFSGLFAFRQKGFKDIGYMVFFLFFVIGIFYFKTYANSGFAAIINAVRSLGEVYFDLEAGVPFNELIDDRFYPVTIIFIFMGMFEIILLNIFVSTYMSLKLPVFVALFMYAIPLYFQSEPELVYVFCMLAGLAGIYIFKNNGRRVYTGAVLVVAGVLVLLGIGTVFFSSGDLSRRYVENEYKAATREGVSEFISRGFAMFYPDYYSSGGMSEGDIGGITAIRPTGQVRLQVEYTPYDTQPVYLKAFTGLVYNKSKWGSDVGDTRIFLNMINQTEKADKKRRNGGTKKKKGTSFYNYNDYSAKSFLHVLGDRAEKARENYGKDREHNARGRMNIYNMTAEMQYQYLPYFTEASGTLMKAMKTSESADSSGAMDAAEYSDSIWVDYYPPVGKNAVSETAMSRETYQQDWQLPADVLYSDLQVPEENMAAVTEACRAAGLDVPPDSGMQWSNTFRDLRSSSESTSHNDQLKLPAMPGTVSGSSDVVNKVVSYLKENYSYSYSPGSVPDGMDAVNYFLTENKKGVCAHFASAAALMFRRLGYPARYVEGYVIDYATATDARIENDKRYEDYYDGYSPIGKTAVVEAYVTDAAAHGWVEVYEWGKGWQIADPTPSVIESGGDGSFWRSLEGLLSDSPDMNLENGGGPGFLQGGHWRAVGITLLAILAIASLVWWLKKFVPAYRTMHGENRQAALLYAYRKACRKREKRDPEFARLSTPSERIPYLIGIDPGEGHPLSPEDTARKEDAIQRIEAACFGAGQPEEKEYQKLLEMLKKGGRR